LAASSRDSPLKCFISLFEAGADWSVLDKRRDYNLFHIMGMKRQKDKIIYLLKTDAADLYWHMNGLSQTGA